MLRTQRARFVICCIAQQPSGGPTRSDNVSVWRRHSIKHIHNAANCLHLVALFLDAFISRVRKPSISLGSLVVVMAWVVPWPLMCTCLAVGCCANWWLGSCRQRHSKKQLISCSKQFRTDTMTLKLLRYVLKPLGRWLTGPDDDVFL